MPTLAPPWLFFLQRQRKIFKKEMVKNLALKVSTNKTMKYKKDINAHIYNQQVPIQN